jgi:hypothetical protein
MDWVSHLTPSLLSGWLLTNVQANNITTLHDTQGHTLLFFSSSYTSSTLFGRPASSDSSRLTQYIIFHEIVLLKELCWEILRRNSIFFWAIDKVLTRIGTTASFYLYGLLWFHIGFSKFEAIKGRTSLTDLSHWRFPAEITLYISRLFEFCLEPIQSRWFHEALQGIIGQGENHTWAN